jgi:hypothetical protein
MRYLLYILVIFSIVNCTPSRNLIAIDENTNLDSLKTALVPIDTVILPKIAKDIYRETLFSDGWTSIFGAEDATIIQFSYQYQASKYRDFLRVFISKKDNKAIIFRHQQEHDFFVPSNSLHKFEVQNPFTKEIEKIHIVQNDTIELNTIQWDSLKNQLDTFPLERYPHLLKVDRTEELGGVMTFNTINQQDANNAVIRTQQGMEFSFYEMCSILFRMLDITDIPLKMPKKEVEPKQLLVFENLIGGTWTIKADLEDGEVFHQKHQYEWSLDKRIVKVKTRGTIDEDTKEFGLRDEGIRAYNPKDSTIRFWEFDVFGGVTEGLVLIDNDNFEYIYNYSGHTLRHKWIYVDSDTYEFIILSEKDGKMTELLRSAFTRSFFKEK